MPPSESPDGYDTVEWIASQSWCDGSVGTVGGSARGMLQWMLAPEQPPHLKAISPWVIGAMDPDPVAVTGHVRLAVLLNRVTGNGLDIAAKLQEQGTDVSDLRRMIQRATDDPSEVFNYLPLENAPQFQGLKDLWNFQRSGSHRTMDGHSGAGDGTHADRRSNSFDGCGHGHAENGGGCCQEIGHARARCGGIAARD